MTTRPKMNVVPTVQPPELPADQEKRAFIAGAQGKSTLPWQTPGRRDDLTVAMHMRMPETLMLKVEWLAAAGDETRRAIVQRALEEYTNSALHKMGLEP